MRLAAAFCAGALLFCAGCGAPSTQGSAKTTESGILVVRPEYANAQETDAAQDAAAAPQDAAQSVDANDGVEVVAPESTVESVLGEADLNRALSALPVTIDDDMRLNNRRDGSVFIVRISNESGAELAKV